MNRTQPGELNEIAPCTRPTHRASHRTRAEERTGGAPGRLPSPASRMRAAITADQQAGRWPPDSA